MPQSTSSRAFWDNVEKTDGCWWWRAGKTSRGYGVFYIQPKQPVYAHRYVYQLVTGVDPGDLHVLHECDNPSCVRPEHLFLGTHQDNMADMYAKGRRTPATGERASGARLTWDQVREIRRLLPTVTVSALAQQFNVDRHTIRIIRDNKSWKETKIGC